MWLRTPIVAMLLVAGAWLSLASTWDGGRGSEEVREPAVDVVDATWVVANLYDGQTAVRENLVISLTLGERDFLSDAAEHLSTVLLYRADDGTPVELSVQVTWEGATLTPAQWLSVNTDYVLDLAPLAGRLVSRRWLPEPIHFTTRSAPRVLGVWRNEDTLILEFSQPMNADLLYPGAQSVDVLWEEDGELVSLAMDHNLAAFAWQTNGALFLLAPFDPPTDVWIKVSGAVEGLGGTPLDGDGDGTTGQPTDDFLEWVSSEELPQCYTRSDIPRPCMALEDVPDQFSW